MNLIGEIVSEIEDYDSISNFFDVVRADEVDEQKISVVVAPSVERLSRTRAYRDFVSREQKKSDWTNSLRDSKRRFYDGTNLKFYEDWNPRFHELVEDYNSQSIESELHSIANSLIVKFQSEGDYEDDPVQSANDIEWDVFIQREEEYFNLDYIHDLWEEERLSLYADGVRNHLDMFAMSIENDGYVDGVFGINLAAVNDTRISITWQIHGYYAAQKRFKRELESFYHRTDYKRMVRHPVLSRKNPDKLANDWNSTFHHDVLESEHFDEFKRILRKRLSNFAEKLYHENKINMDQYYYMNDVDFDFKLNFTEVFKEEDIAYRAAEDREKYLKEKRRR